jgi:uncharacterized protein
MEMNSRAGVLIHAPSPAAVQRARNNAANLLKLQPDTAIRIVVNAEGVAALLDTPRSDTDRFTLVCATTLERIGREAPAPLRTIPVAIVELTQMQLAGWIYVRA